MSDLSLVLFLCSRQPPFANKVFFYKRKRFKSATFFNTASNPYATMNQETSVSANEIPEQLQLKDNGAEFRPIVHPSVNFA